MPTTLLEDYSYVRSREPESTFGNVDVLNLVEEMIRAPGDHHWEVYASGVLPPGESDVYYLIVSGSDPAQPNQRVAFLVDDTSFRVGYDPDGTVEWDEVEEEFVHDGAFSGLCTLAGSDLELVDGQLQPASLDLGDLGPIRVWLTEHREINECDSPCSVGRAASLTLLIEKVETNEADNSFVYGAHVGRVLSRMDLNDEDKGIYGDAVFVGKPATPGRLGPEEPVSDPDHQSWLGQPNNSGGSVVRTGLTEWSPAYGVGWDNHLPDGSMRNVGARKRLLPYGVNGLEEEYGGDWLMVSAGGGHSLGIRKDGTLWAWGDNYYGQLGIGTSGNNEFTFQDPPDSNKPVRVIVPAGHPGEWKYASAGLQHSLGIDSNGRAWAWGNNADGRTGLGTNNGVTNAPSAVITGGATSIPTAWKQLSAGGTYSLGIDSNDEAWGWGSNTYGQLGTGDGSLSEIPKAVDTSDSRPEKWKQLSASSDDVFNMNAHSLGIDSVGRAWAWGKNDVGQCGTAGSSFNSPTAVDTDAGRPQTYMHVSAGSQHSLGISDDGSAWAWGFNDNGQLGDGTTTQKTVPTAVDANAGKPQTWKLISAGGSHSLGISADSENDGSAWAWGFNDNGQLGDGTTTQKTVPTAVDANAGKPQTWKLISAGGSHSLGISADSENDGSAWAWGQNALGQLGIGNETDQLFSANVPYIYKIYNGYLHGEVGRTKYLRQFGTEPLDHGVKFVTTTEFSLQAWLPLSNGSNQLILWRRGDNNNDVEIEDNGDDDEAV